MPHNAHWNGESASPAMLLEQIQDLLDCMMAYIYPPDDYQNLGEHSQPMDLEMLKIHDNLRQWLGCSNFSDAELLPGDIQLVLHNEYVRATSYEEHFRVRDWVRDSTVVLKAFMEAYPRENVRFLTWQRSRSLQEPNLRIPALVQELRLLQGDIKHAGERAICGVANLHTKGLVDEKFSHNKTEEKPITPTKEWKESLSVGNKSESALVPEKVRWASEDGPESLSAVDPISEYQRPDWYLQLLADLRSLMADERDYSANTADELRHSLADIKLSLAEVKQSLSEIQQSSANVMGQMDAARELSRIRKALDVGQALVEEQTLTGAQEPSNLRNEESETPQDMVQPIPEALTSLCLASAEPISFTPEVEEPFVPILEDSGLKDSDSINATWKPSPDNSIELSSRTMQALNKAEERAEFLCGSLGPRSTTNEDFNTTARELDHISVTSPESSSQEANDSTTVAEELEQPRIISAEFPSHESDGTMCTTGESGQLTPDSLEILSVANSDEPVHAADNIIPSFTDILQDPSAVLHASPVSTASVAGRLLSSSGSSGGRNWEVVGEIVDGEEFSLDQDF